MKMHRQKLKRKITVMKKKEDNVKRTSCLVAVQNYFRLLLLYHYWMYVRELQ